MASIRMIMACGAESRIAKKYSACVEEATQHSRFMSPLIAMQFGLIVGIPVCQNVGYANLPIVLWSLCGVWSSILVRHQVCDCGSRG